MERKRIAILSHFGSFDPGYALHVGWIERAKLLALAGQDFDFLVNDNCKTLEAFPNSAPVLGRIPEGKPWEERVAFFEGQYRRLLPEYDAVLTADLVYQRKGNFLAQNQAMRNVAKDLRAWWYHWVHSGWVERPGSLRHPESLRFSVPPRSTLVYLNSAELSGLRSMYGAAPDQVACVYNPKDPRNFFGFHPLSWKIISALDLPGKDAIQIFPHCATRMDAKGVDAVLHVFAALKRRGLKVALIMAVAHARKVQAEIVAKKRLAESLGLAVGKDVLWTCDLTENFAPLPRQAVADLYRVANLFVFASWRETVGNVFQEAKISGNLLVLSNRVPCLVEMGGPDAIYFDATSKTPGRADGMSGDMQLVRYANATQYFDVLAGQIIERLPSRAHLWQFSYEWIWKNQLKPLLYGRAEKQEESEAA